MCVGWQQPEEACSGAECIASLSSMHRALCLRESSWLEPGRPAPLQQHSAQRPALVAASYLCLHPSAAQAALHCTALHASSAAQPLAGATRSAPQPASQACPPARTAQPYSSSIPAPQHNQLQASHTVLTASISDCPPACTAGPYSSSIRCITCCTITAAQGAHLHALPSRTPARCRPPQGPCPTT